MKTAAFVEFANRRRIVALLGKPPKGILRIDVLALRFQNNRRPSRKDDTTVYMTLDEAAWVITVLSQGLKKAVTNDRERMARRYRR